MANIKNISGFPEWLPEVRRFEMQVIERIRKVYESFGFVSIETPAVELLSNLLSKGGPEKEIYALHRANAEALEEAKNDAELGLHFDLTVPFARYVAQHMQHLKFPFKRYQVQKVWRGERAQKGRSREFYQFDIDIVARENLPLSCDAEILEAYGEAWKTLGIHDYVFKFNNRKLLLGFYEELGIPDVLRPEAIRIVDKIDKIGKEAVGEELAGKLALSSQSVARLLEACTLRAKPTEMREALLSFRIENGEFQTGIEELEQICALLPEDLLGRLELDFSLARGLDYYSGIILETRILSAPEYGSVGSGGRYDSLASHFTSQKLPGVGFSIGLTRLIEYFLEKKLIPESESSPVKVFFAVFEEGERKNVLEFARSLRAFGVVCEVSPQASKLGKQIEAASKKRIPYVFFPGTGGRAHEVKNLHTGEQEVVSDIEQFAKKLQES